MSRMFDGTSDKNVKLSNQSPLITTPRARKAAVDQSIVQSLEEANKKLNAYMAAGNKKGIAKMQEIIANLEGTVSRQHQ